jgi:hypothetical protein
LCNAGEAGDGVADRYYHGPDFALSKLRNMVFGRAAIIGPPYRLARRHHFCFTAPRRRYG